MKELAGPFDLLPGCRVWIAVFSASESKAPFDPHAAQNQLSVEDFQRWSRYRLPEKRSQFLNSRRVVDEVIRRELERVGAKLQARFCRQESGRPAVVDQNGNEIFSISLSHSTNAVAVAVTELPGRIGVDVEVITPFNDAALLRCLATESDIAWVNRQPEGIRAELVRTVWVTKEAIWKTGIATESLSFCRIRSQWNSPEGRACQSSIEDAAVPWRTALFVLNCPEVAQPTAALQHPLLEGAGIRGCLASAL